ncbi:MULTISPECIES: YhgE/Pip domain-containing protein [unclassified Paenibacillus]|uniref:YhgE/Pip domain-containing protein n=1 Tax=Paenibacillus TaxID=44249 RepID=UPI0004176F8E|nr:MULTISPECIES: ABC transporter permease [unclassified Paenibacillus]KKC46824.1 membrane protein [Paenibacillus sp. D9]
MAIFKQKMVWAGTIIVLAVLVVFGAAMMGSVLGTKPKEVPAALVVLDHPADLPGGGSLAVGEKLKEQLLSNDKLPIKWTVLDSEQAAREALDAREYYGALILPADLSSGVASIAGASPQQPAVRVLVSEGLNAQASTVLRQGLGQVMSMAGAELSKSMLAGIAQKSQQLPVTVAQALLSPIQVQEETVHPVGANNASGSAPGLLTQIMWMGSLVTAMMLFLAGGKAIQSGAGRPAAVAWQPVIGVAITGIASGFLVWTASSWYGMELAHSLDTWLFLWLAAVTFYMLQSALLNWIGLPAMAILVLLMFFSMPLLNMAPEFLTDTTHFWIYSWTPLRFAAYGMREVMYFGGLDSAGGSAAVLAGIAGAFLLALLGSGWKKSRAAGKTETVPASA